MRILPSLPVLLVALLAFALGVWAAPKYDRSEWRFWRPVGIWKTTDNGQECRADVRDAVVRRQALGSTLTVARGKAGGCLVDAEIFDLYGDRATLPVGHPKDVDHLVSLEEAHDAGAWLWSPERKAEYANDLTFRWHIIAVDASENRSKGSRGPAAWRPRRREVWCQWALWRSAVKIVWNLRTTLAERAALQEMLGTC